MSPQNSNKQKINTTRHHTGGAEKITEVISSGQMTSIIITPHNVLVPINQVKHLDKKKRGLIKAASLANLYLSNEEQDQYEDQLSDVLDYVEQLNQVDTKDVEPTFNVSGKTNVIAKNEIGDCTLPPEDALSNAPKKEDGFFITKGVFEE